MTLLLPDSVDFRLTSIAASLKTDRSTLAAQLIDTGLRRFSLDAALRQHVGSEARSRSGGGEGSRPDRLLAFPVREILKSRLPGEAWRRAGGGRLSAAGCRRCGGDRPGKDAGRATAGGGRGRGVGERRSTPARAAFGEHDAGRYWGGTGRMAGHGGRPFLLLLNPN